MERGEISSFLDESHVQLDASLVGMDHNDYVDDMPSQYSKKAPNKFGKKKGKKGLSKPMTSISEKMAPGKVQAARGIQSFPSLNI